MNTFEQDLKEAYLKLEKDMATIASLFLPRKKIGYLGENIMLIDFEKTDFKSATSKVDTQFTRLTGYAGYYEYKGIEFRVNEYPKNNRIAFTF